MSVRDFKLPDLGEGLTDAEVVRWLVGVDDVIEVDQPLVEVVTAKANVELPSPFGGVVVSLHHASGDVVEVGSPLLSIREAAESSADESGNVLVGYGTRPEHRRRRRAAPIAPEEAPALAPTRQRPAVVSPVVRRLARQLGVDLASIEGSGPRGVITRGDVEGAAAGGASTAAAAAASASAGSVERPARTGGASPERDADRPEIERIPIRGAQRQMAERLARSRREIPEATVWVDADATGLLEAKGAISEAHPELPEGVGITSLLGRFCVLGLRRWPLLNSRIEGDEIVVSRRVNLGFAAQTARGLVVPVVHDADQLELLELDREIRRLTRAAREGKLTSGDVAGGTVTLNNYGVFGVDGSAAIINFPEVAIVGIGRILQRPWVVDRDIRSRPVTELSLAFDHRVCDGGVAGGFLRFVADCVEHPVRLLSL